MRRAQESPSASPPPVVNGGECTFTTDPSLPPDAGCVSTVTAGEERLTVYAPLDDDARPRRWRMRLVGPNVDIDQRLFAGNDYSYPRALGATDFDDDGTTEWWIKAMDYTSHGAPWSGARVFVHADGRLSALELDGRSLAVNYGGITRMGEGAECVDGRLVLLRAEAQNVRNTRWETSRRTLAIDGAQARLLHRKTGLLTISDYNDPDLDPFYRIDCDGFVFP